MKKIFLSILLFCVIKGYCQDAVKIRQIDSLVKVINQPGFKPTYDSIINDYPDLGLFMKTYLTTVANGTELKKYVNEVHSARLEKGISKQMMTSSAFYFDQSKLIKVEEFGTETDKELHFDWYYSDDKPLYYSLQTDKAADRAALLLTIADAILKQIQK